MIITFKSSTHGTQYLRKNYERIMHEVIKNKTHHGTGLEKKSALKKGEKQKGSYHATDNLKSMTSAKTDGSYVNMSSALRQPRWEAQNSPKGR